ncbi:hypothetical protein O3G_MSEX010567 [Manduca sexta]|uniref:PX domain-containing protein n=1 Tax=Manduca sexta TaxID=7130 RepID=A0A921ZHJ2_MANSE|nr:hypothetical protein O3G_MSEX010567 [Manduca sexta]
MSEGPDTPPFSTVDINNDGRDDEDLFASAVQEVSLDPEVNGAREDLEKVSISDAPPSITTTLSSPVLEEIATERANNIIITITEPQKIGEGMMSSYVAYRVLTKTNMPIFSKHEFAVLRRFSDFLGLHEKLTEKYLRSGRIIPPAPEKSIVAGTTKLKMTSTPSTESANGSTPTGGVQSQFVERRRAALERFVNRVAQHPVLSIDPDFREFLESEAELPKATSTSALSGAGVLRLFNKVGETVNKFTYRMDEADPIEHLRLEQSNTDFYVLAEHIKDYLGLIGAIKDVFHERVKVFQNWQHAQMQLTKRRENKAKAELANRPEKIEQASNEIIEWEAKVERGQQEFDTISRVIKKEIERWDELRQDELRAALLRYLEEHMKHQAQAIRYWDAFLPEARAIK